MSNFPLVLCLVSLVASAAVHQVAGGPCDENNGGCSHDCTEVAGGGHQCSCPPPLKLKDDGRHCGADGVKLTCNTNGMQIDLPRSLFHEMYDEHLRLIDPECGATSNDSFFSLSTSHTGCGTTSSVVGGYIVYKNRVMEMPNEDSAVVTTVGKGEVEVPFSCYYLDREILTAVAFKPVAKPLYVKVKGRGNYKLNLNFYKGPFGQRSGAPGMWGEEDFPVKVKLRQRLYFEASLDTHEKDLRVFAANCCSTPTADHEATHKFRHALIVDGCPVDPSVQFHHSGSPTVQRFSVRAFKFLGEHDFVFIHCRIYVCDANDPNSRCAQGCTRPQRGLKGPKKPSPHHSEQHKKVPSHVSKKTAKIASVRPEKHEKKIAPHHEQKKVVHVSEKIPVKIHHEKQKKLSAPHAETKVVHNSDAKAVKSAHLKKPAPLKQKLTAPHAEKKAVHNSDAKAVKSAHLKKPAPLKQKKEVKPVVQPKEKKSSNVKMAKSEKKIHSHIADAKEGKTAHPAKKSSVLKKANGKNQPLEALHQGAPGAKKEQAPEEFDINKMIADLMKQARKAGANHVTKRDVSHAEEDTTSGFVEISQGPFVVDEKPKAKVRSYDGALVQAKKNEVRADVREDQAKPGSPLSVSASDGVLVVMTVASLLALVGVIYLGRQANKRTNPYDYTPLMAHTS